VGLPATNVGKSVGCTVGADDGLDEGAGVDFPGR